MTTRFRTIALAIVVVVLLVPLAACGATAAPTTVPPTVAPKATTPPTAVPPTVAPTKLPATAVPPTTAAGPTTGGTLVYAVSQEPDTLDVQKTNMGAMHYVMSLVGAALVSIDPETGKVVPYLADSWTFSADGLTWTFKLHPGVKFHDGTPLTAKDYAWTFNRALDPATKSVSTGSQLLSTKSAEATDDQTLVLHLGSPSFYLLQNLAMASYCSPLPQAAVTKAGDAWGRSPIGVGPYKFVSWQTGSKIVIQRNPDYKWRPAWNKGSGPYIDTIEYRIVPDVSTVQAGLEAGELDYAELQEKDVARTRATGKLDVLTAVWRGVGGFIALNQTVPALADLAVRQAMAYAVDRVPFVQAVWNGDAIPVTGPLGPGMAGYDKVQETYALPFDVAKAKSTLAAAGYSAGSDGVMKKGDVKLKFALTAPAGNDQYTNMAQIAQQQWKAIGIQMDIQQLDMATVVGNMFQGKYEATLMSYGWPNASFMLVLYGGKAIGGNNILQLQDPAFDTLLQSINSLMDVTKQQNAVNAMAKYLMDGAYLVNFGSPKSFFAMNTRVKGFSISAMTSEPDFLDAYIAK